MSLFRFIIIFIFISNYALLTYTFKFPKNRGVNRINQPRSKNRILPFTDTKRGLAGDGFWGGNGGGFDISASISDGEDPKNIGNSKLSSGIVMFLSSLLEKYSRLLDSSPYATKIITSGLLGGLGDYLIQNIERKKNPKPFDFRRLFIFVLVTAFYIAPVIHIWFDSLNRLPFPAGMSNRLKAGIMMLIDQTVGAVVINIGFFYAFELVKKLVPQPDPMLKDSRSFLTAAYDTCKASMWITLVANWYCWPIINYINFLYIPIQYRVAFSNIIAIFWNMFLSNVANKS